MSKVYIIAEAGVNHNGNYDLAKCLIDAAKTSGADAVKFQTFNADKLVSKNARMAQYQIENLKKEESQFNMLKKLELSINDYINLRKYASDIGIDFLSSPFDRDSLDFLTEKLYLNVIKVPSGEINNVPFLKMLASKNLEVILSSGMSRLGEIEYALDIFRSCDDFNNKITVLHCNSDYPTEFHDVNLKAMITIKKAFGVSVGYSDHSIGTEVPIAATALGASIIEKHLTLNKTMEGPDHKASLNPSEFKKMVECIRNIEKALGNGIKKPSLSEMKNIDVVRKSLFAKNDIKKGDVFTEDNIIPKRPGTGISVINWESIIGKKSRFNFKADEMIKL